MDALNGEQNRWTINNDLDRSCDLGVEIVRGIRQVAIADYWNPLALTIETFDGTSRYRMSHQNDYEKYALEGGKLIIELDNDIQT